jgi:hypothetical protein
VVREVREVQFLPGDLVVPQDLADPLVLPGLGSLAVLAVPRGQPRPVAPEGQGGLADRFVDIAKQL